jgi:hypothetical protein
MTSTFLSPLSKFHHSSQNYQSSRFQVLEGTKLFLATLIFCSASFFINATTQVMHHQNLSNAFEGKTMATTFPIFSRFPPEVRDMIWVAAIWPRFVEIIESQPPEEATTFTEWQSRHDFNGQSPLYLYSDSPVPILLQTCRDSRAALQKDGYRLTFGAPLATDSRPRIWFHFKKDVLYHRATKNRSSFLNTLTWVKKADMAKVKRLAIACSLARMELCDAPENQFPRRPLADLRRFAGLEELMLVQSDPYTGLWWRKPGGERQGGLMGFAECDIADVLGYCQPREPVMDAWIDEFETQIRELKMEKHGHDRGFFRDLAARFGGWMWGSCEAPYVCTRDMAFRTMGCQGKDKDDEGEGEDREESCFLRPPEVRVVHLVTLDRARELMDLREKFWGWVQEVEDREAFLGLSPRPTSLVDVEWDEVVPLFRFLYE